ncbi:MAG TPA: MFS transporter [Spirochaetia bacterium]|nr:MFS transporter [Spirochaetia bacterium]
MSNHLEVSGHRDIVILFTTRIARLFAYGFLSVVLALYLVSVGLSGEQVGLLFTLTLAGDAAVSLLITTTADRLGRRRMLVIGTLLMIVAGVVFLLTHNFILLIIAAIIGVISPSGNEIGPFLSIEQAALSQLVSDNKRTRTFAWYNLVGSFATATGALSGGWMAQGLQLTGWSRTGSYRAVLAGYAIIGLILFVLFLTLSKSVEAPRVERQVPRLLGLHKSRGIVFRLSAFFAADAFAGGLIIQSMIAYWFHLRFGIDAGTIGTIFFGANVLAGVSALLAVRIARKIGLLRTMVFTHIPSNILLILVPLMPTLPLAIGVLLARFSISQMDVPTRQSFTMAVVEPDERSSAAGVTSIARSVGAALSPSLTGIFFASAALVSLPFFLSGGIKIIYDLALLATFRNVTPPEEKKE